MSENMGELGFLSLSQMLRFQASGGLESNEPEVSLSVTYEEKMEISSCACKWHVMAYIH